MSELVDDLLNEFGPVQTGRSEFEQQWQEVAERVWPAHVNTFHTNGEGKTPGAKNTDKLLDSTAAIALTRFGAILDSLLTKGKWHKLMASNPDLQKLREVRAYFEAATNVLFKYRYAPKANFQAQNHEIMKMLGAYGTGPIFVDNLREEPGLRYRATHLGEIYFRQNHQGIIDQSWRRFRYDARQVMQRWPNVKSTHVRNAVEKKSADKFWIIHCIKPNSDRLPHRRDFRGMAYSSYYILQQEKEILEIGGYNTWPYPTGRYNQSVGEDYGRSPAMDVLPAIKTLNDEKKTVLKQGHRSVDPVLLMPDDGVIDSFSLKPGAMNAGGMSPDGRARVGTLPVGNIAIGKDLMDDERVVINDAFLVTLFQILMETPQMTATEVIERVKEKGILLTPTVGQQQSGYLGPLIEREIDVLSRQGLLPPMPGVLIEARGEYTIEYDGMLSRAARAEEAAGVLRSIEATLNVVNVTQDPAPLDHYDWDIIVPEVAEINGVPLHWMRDPRIVAQMRKERREQIQQQQMIDAAPAAAGLMKATQGARA